MPTYPRAIERIESLSSQQLTTQGFIEGVAEQLRATLPIDGLFMAATDPETLHVRRAGVAHGMPETVCAPFWEYEFEVPDFNKFSDLARGPRHVADLHAATGGRPERSARWREFGTLMDTGAELRATFNAGGRGWGMLHLNRAGATRGFGQDEIAFVETVAPIVGRGLRAPLTSQPAAPVAGRGPGMAVFDGQNRLVSATPEALAWCDELESGYRLHDAAAGRDLPCEIGVAAMEARARAAVD